MGPSIDSALLCREDDFGVFSDEVDFGFEPNQRVSESSDDKNLSFDGGDDVSFVVLPVQSEECLGLMVRRESEHLPSFDYVGRYENGDLDLGARKEAIDWIGKVQAHYNFGPLCAYLAVNYLDRFLSGSGGELLGKAWSMQLLAVACLSIAAKMEETDVPLSLDLQVGQPKFVFEAKTIMKMELIVLSTLKWRMQAISPFSFLDYFLHKINDDKDPPRSSICLCTQLILTTIKGIDYLKFRPSEFAAAVAVFVHGQTQTVDIEKSISLLTHHVGKERVFKCVELLQKQFSLPLPLKSPITLIAFLPQSPIGVLDAASLSYKTDDKAVGSCSNSSQNSPQTKRRKLNMPCEVEI